MVNSNSKGKRGELEFSHWLKDNLGIEARRGQQYSGGGDSPDVVTDLDNIHFEVKRTETLSLYKAMAQALEDCGEKTPVVAHRRSRKEWLLVIPADKALDFAREFIRVVNPNKS